MNANQQYQHGSLPEPIADNASDLVQATPVPPTSQSEVPRQQVALQVQEPSQQPVPVAQDSEVIDPAWIAQVNTTIKSSVADPRILSQKFAKLKAQYISSRYGHDIKQSSEKG